MHRLFTNEELRIAARQAITLALAMTDEASRDDMLRRAQRLLDEAKRNHDAFAREPEAPMASFGPSDKNAAQHRLAQPIERLS
jgi:hypothetical protein